MKKAFFILAVATLLTVNLNAQTKKDGTPDMRYRSNKQTYGNPYSKSSYSTPKTSTANYSTPVPTYNATTRPIYSGQTPKESHGGTYVGSTNAHHKNGTYINPSSNNNYGIHKTKNK